MANARRNKHHHHSLVAPDRISLYEVPYVRRAPDGCGSRASQSYSRWKEAAVAAVAQSWRHRHRGCGEAVFKRKDKTSALKNQAEEFATRELSGKKAMKEFPNRGDGFGAVMIKGR
jgi:hypothetical protein